MSEIPEDPLTHPQPEVRLAELEARLSTAQGLLRRAVHLEAVVRAALGGMPEFRNLLTGIQGHTRLLLEEKALGDPDRDSLLRITTTTARAIELLGSLRGMAAEPAPEEVILDLSEQISEASVHLRMILGEDVVLDVDLLETASVAISPADFRNMLVGLTIHALDRVAGTGMVRLALERDRAVSDTGTVSRWAVLTMADTGDESTTEAVNWALDPLLAPMRPGRTLGIGLNVAQMAAQKAGGRLEVQSTPTGSRVRIYLPMADSGRSGPTSAQLQVNSTEHILVVDDDDAVRDVAAKILRRMGYRVTTADSGEAAIELVLEMEQPPDLLLSDIVMPGMNGRELSERFKVLHPDRPVLFMSAYTEDEVILRGIQVSEVNFLPKPFTLEGLGRTVREVLDAASGPGGIRTVPTPGAAPDNRPKRPGR